MEFVEDVSIEERFRSRLSDYRGSGYDRGHMVRTGLSLHLLLEMPFQTHGQRNVYRYVNRYYFILMQRLLTQM